MYTFLCDYSIDFCDFELPQNIPGISFILTNSRLCLDNSEDEVDNHGTEQGQGKDRRTYSVIKTTLSSLSDALGAPMEGE